MSRLTVPGTLLLSCLASAGLAAEPPLAPFPEIPATEITVGSLIPDVGDQDDAAAVFGSAGPDTVVVHAEEFRILARRSTDGGATFGPGTVLAGGPGQLPAVFHKATQGPDGTIHVALLVMDPLGGLGLQVVRSEDLGQTWAPAVDVVRSGAPTHDLVRRWTHLALAAGPGGRVAVLFADGVNSRFHVTASADGGRTWTPSVRVDPGAGTVGGATWRNDVAIGPDGRIHVLYVQTRSAGTQLLYTRSLDGGLTFEPERVLPRAGRVVPEPPTWMSPPGERCWPPSSGGPRWRSSDRPTAERRSSPS